MRYVRVVLALAFGLAMAGPEAQDCHHHPTGRHHKPPHSTAPQACCPADVRVAVPTTAPSWTAAPRLVITVNIATARPGPLPSRKRLLPFALAPPQPLA